ncbi:MULTISPECIES: hypothetical protein, partial [Streptomyces]|uniref:hypothetical protein n=1 Tax=Streptomyces TaxID=1883 RepID=UPI002248DB13
VIGHFGIQGEATVRKMATASGPITELTAGLDLQDSKERRSTVITLSADGWSAIATAVKTGAFDARNL